MNYMKRLCISIGAAPLLPLIFFYSLPLCDIIQLSDTQREAVTIKRITQAELAKELREQYIKHPPEGMTSEEILNMSDDDLLDMDYFLHEFDKPDDDDWGEEGFYIF